CKNDAAEWLPLPAPALPCWPAAPAPPIIPAPPIPAVPPPAARAPAARVTAAAELFSFCTIGDDGVALAGVVATGPPPPPAPPVPAGCGEPPSRPRFDARAVAR